MSSSRCGDTGFLNSGLPIVESFLPENVKELLFIPFANAAKRYDEYEEKVAVAFSDIGLTVRSIHHLDNSIAEIHSAQAIVIGGGNTFALLSRLQEANLLDPIRQAVNAGTPFIGWSAGTNIACPTIQTTNDMPVIQPAGFAALALIPLPITPHYIEGKIKGHNGESREQRLSEFLAINPEEQVLALPEGSALLQLGRQNKLCGEVDGILFRSKGRQTVGRNEDLSWIWDNGTRF